MEEKTQEWNQYEYGLSYKSKINLLPTIDKNERFYSKRHWEGVKTNGLPAAVLPYSKRIVDFKISMVMSDMVAMNFTAEGIADNTEDEMELQYKEIASLLTDYARTMAENTKFDTMNENGLLDAALSGDMVSFWYWDETIDVGNGQKGELCGHLVDNVNYFPGDVNNPEINSVYGPVQPYIELSFREQVQDVRDEAKRNNPKITDEELQRITADADTQNQAGDRAKNEIDADKDEGKCIVLLKLWRKLENGKWKIYAKKSTRSVVIRDTWDTGLSRYPVALMNWDLRKGSCHGEAEMTSLIPNQIVINQMASMIALWIKLHGFPKVIYDKTRIPAWDNSLQTAIAVNGSDNGGVGGAAQYMQPGQISAAVQQFFNTFIQLTKESAGANEAVLGEAAPVNTSAIIVNSKNAAVPLNSIKRRFYRYIEDVGLIWLDFWMSKYSAYPNKKIEVMRDGIKYVETIDTGLLNSVRFKLKLDVGPSSQWNEAAAVQTLDNLLARDLITFVEYLKRIPKGMIPDAQGLIDSRGDDSDMQLLYELVAKFAAQLPPEIQQQLQGMNVQQAKDAVKQLVLDGTMPSSQQQLQPKTQTQQQPTEARPYSNNVGGNQNGMQPMQK